MHRAMSAERGTTSMAMKQRAPVPYSTMIRKLAIKSARAAASGDPWVPQGRHQ